MDQIAPISTHTSHEGRDNASFGKNDFNWCISTHTSHAGRDLPGGQLPLVLGISTHTSHAGRD